ncbi:MAG: hypothetical protein DDT31_01747 [Syntrophomonadaceae bacterium]|nr:hypothetical protein [Bacillota bacterium]
MAIEKEIWLSVIQENLYKDNALLDKVSDESAFVVDGSVVHIPQAGAMPTVTLGTVTVPVSVTQRTDTDITYPLEVARTVPTLIQKNELAALSYDKVQSILSNHTSSLKESISEYFLQKWGPAGAGLIVRTSGTAVVAHTAAATGDRKKFTYKEILNARKIMDTQNVPKEDRYILLDPELYAQLMDDETLLKRDFQRDVDLKNGIIGRLFGFEVMDRSSTLIYDNATVPVKKALGAASAATDNAAALCWQKQSLCKAIGNIDVFEKIDDPQFYGSIYSVESRFGGRIKRSDSKGVIAIVQAVAPAV